MISTMNNYPIHSFINSKKSKGTLDLYKKHLVFKLEHDHTPRIVFYNQIDKVLIKKRGWIWWLSFCFSLFFTGVSISLFRLNSTYIWNLLTAILLLISTISNYSVGKQRLIQVRKGSLVIDVFRSSNCKELSKAYYLLENAVLISY